MADALADGQLKSVVFDWQVPAAIPINALMSLGRFNLTRVRAFLDVFVENRVDWGRSAPG